MVYARGYFLAGRPYMILRVTVLAVNFLKINRKLVDRVEQKV